MISLNIQADNVTELTEALRTLGGAFDVSVAEPSVAVHDTPFETEPVEPVDRPETAAVTEAEAQEIPRQSVKQPAEETKITEQPVTQPAEEPEAPKQPGAPAVKMEDARAALNELRQKKGAAAVRELLQKHGVQSFIDLDAKEYPTIVKEAKNHE